MVNLNDIHVGDRVKIVDKWCKGCGENKEGRMDKYLGRTVTVKYVRGLSSIAIEEDNGLWYWYPSAIECIVDDTMDRYDDWYNDSDVCRLL